MAVLILLDTSHSGSDGVFGGTALGALGAPDVHVGEARPQSPPSSSMKTTALVVSVSTAP